MNVKLFNIIHLREHLEISYNNTIYSIGYKNLYSTKNRYLNITVQYTNIVE